MVIDICNLNCATTYIYVYIVVDKVIQLAAYISVLPALSRTSQPELPAGAPAIHVTCIRTRYMYGSSMIVYPFISQLEQRKFAKYSRKQDVIWLLHIVQGYFIRV